MEVVITIIPIFFIILLGWISRKRKFITQDFMEPANKLVFNLSIPALIFGTIAKTSFEKQFNARVLFITLSTILLIYCISFIISKVSKMDPSRAGAFVLCSSHGNVGYIGLPISYYFLPDDLFGAASIICGFIMIAQNSLSVVFLQVQQVTRKHQFNWLDIPKSLMKNPVICSAVSGMIISIAGIELPRIIWRSIDILGGLAPPMALLLIGASLSITLVRRYFAATLGAVSLKLVLLPAAALVFFSLFHLELRDYLPALILLSSPTATIVYVMVGGMHEDADFSVAVISASTLLSSLTVSLWLAGLHMAG